MYIGALLPTMISQLTKLQILNLSYSNIVGSILDSFGELATS